MANGVFTTEPPGNGHKCPNYIKISLLVDITVELTIKLSKHLHCAISVKCRVPRDFIARVSIYYSIEARQRFPLLWSYFEEFK